MLSNYFVEPANRVRKRTCLTDPKLISTREAQHFGLDELLLEQSTSVAPDIYFDD
jgi:hypothetical protein